MNGVIGISSANAITLSSFCRSADVFLSPPLSRGLFIFQVSPVVQLESDLPGTPGPENDGRRRVNDGTDDASIKRFPQRPPTAGNEVRYRTLFMVETELC